MKNMFFKCLQNTSELIKTTEEKEYERFDD